MGEEIIFTGLLCLLTLIKGGCGSGYEGWGGITMHCRDNANKPVDWWFIYKPPVGDTGFSYSGADFIYITAEEDGRWVKSNKPITGSTLLQHTLAALYRLTYKDHMAVVAYNNRNKTVQTSGSMGRGILATDIVGGFWMSHSLPDYPDFTDTWPRFPERELKSGHLFGCISLNRDNIDEIAVAIEQMVPDVSFVHIPEGKLQRLLPNWTFKDKVVSINKNLGNLQMNLSSKDGSPLAVLSRAPGAKQCLYRTFAQTRRLVLDVYGQSDGETLISVCSKTFMVRNIEKISVKLPDKVYYIGYKNENARFAVSTAVHWQRRGDSGEPWVCLSNLDKEDKTYPGGLLVCINNYHIWLAFDNFKISEPEC